jgi:hypothetical protein
MIHAAGMVNGVWLHIQSPSSTKLGIHHQIVSPAENEPIPATYLPDYQWLLEVDKTAIFVTMAV